MQVINKINAGNNQGYNLRGAGERTQQSDACEAWSRNPSALCQALYHCTPKHPRRCFLCPQRNFGRHIVIALSVRPSRFRVRSISPIFFEVGIPNLVCGYILGWGSVAYHYRVTVTLTLTSDLLFRIIMSGAYLLYYLR